MRVNVVCLAKWYTREIARERDREIERERERELEPLAKEQGLIKHALSSFFMNPMFGFVCYATPETYMWVL